MNSNCSGVLVVSSIAVPPLVDAAWHLAASNEAVRVQSRSADILESPNNASKGSHRVVGVPGTVDG